MQLPGIARDIQAILFDAEGVVIDTEQLWDKSQEILMDRRGLQYHRQLLKPLMAGKTIEEGITVMKKHFVLEGTVHELAQERRTLISELLEREAAYIPGFLDFFEQLDRQPVKTAIATALDAALLALVDKRLGLTDLFKGNVFCIAEVENRSKPDPAIFLFAARKVGVAPAYCLVLEDAPHGISAAKRAGMACWALATTFQEGLLTEADRVLHSYEQIGGQFGARFTGY